MTSVTMPQLGESVVEGTVAKWLKREGEAVAKYEPLVEVITDKVNSEVPSPEAGTLARIVVPEGQTVKVGTEIAVIATAAAGVVPEAVEGTGSGDQAAIGETDAAGTATVDGDRLAQHPQTQRDSSLRSPFPSREGGQGVRSAPSAHLDFAAAPDAAAPKYSVEELRRRSSPLVRRLAREHGIDLDQVRGSGTGGRVTKEDTLAFIAARSAVTPPAPVEAVVPAPAAPAIAQPTPVTPPAPAPIVQPAAAAAGAAPIGAAPVSAADEIVVPASPMRRAIAEHMVRSVTTAPHAWTYVEVDVSGLVRWREAVRESFRQREGRDLSFVPFVCKALVEALREHPILNSTWRDGQVVLKQRIQLGVAVALEDGLVVPVIRDADEKSIAGLARALHDLVGRARAGLLTLADVQGGTFTLNNTGALGSILSMPIINQPQAAILTMEAITKRVVVLPGDAIAIRPVLNLCLSFDHRVCDGLQVGRFLQTLKQRLEAMGADPTASIY